MLGGDSRITQAWILPKLANSNLLILLLIFNPELSPASRVFLLQLLEEFPEGLAVNGAGRHDYGVFPIVGVVALPYSGGLEAVFLVQPVRREIGSSGLQSYYRGAILQGRTHRAYQEQLSYALPP